METENNFKILGVRVDDLSRQEITNQVCLFLSEQKFHQIATLNPEFILKSEKNSQFKNILNDCDLNVIDGFGIKLAGFRYGRKLKARVTGIDLMLEILKIANVKKLKIFLVANSGGLSDWKETRDAILKLYPKLNINGIDFDCHSCESRNPVSRLPVSILDSRFHGNDNNYDILFCNFGAPQQEIFINSIKSDTIRLAMGVGGGFDFLTGKIKRAPFFVRKLGLEWFWRLIQQPNRWKRIWNALIIFPIKVIFN